VRGAGAAPAGDELAEPAEPAVHVASVTVSDALTIHEYRHSQPVSGGVITVRTLVTEGLGAWSAPEVRATVPDDWSEPQLGVARSMLGLQERLARGGRPAVLGGFTAVRLAGLPDLELIAVTYARGSAIPGIDGSSRHLVAVLLHPDEFAVVQDGFSTRVLGMLADRARVFPYPPCWEIRDQPVVTPADQARSRTVKAGALLAFGDLRVTAHQQIVDDVPAAVTLVVSLPPDGAGAMQRLWREIPDARAVTLLAQLAPDADGQKVWVVGSDQPHATSVGGVRPVRLGCAFVTLVAGVDQPVLKHFEDGVSVLLTDDGFDQVREALVSGSDLSLPLDPGCDLVVEYRPEAMIDPFTGEVQRAAGGWEMRRPARPAPADGPVGATTIVLGVPDDVLFTRIEADDLVGCIQQVQAVVHRLAEEHPVAAPVQIAIGLTLDPAAPPRVQLASRGGPAPALLDPLAAELAGVDPVPVRDQVSFRLEVELRPPGN